MEYQPELLPKEALIKVLKQKRVSTEGLNLDSKKDLVKAFYTHIIPKPQRDKFRPNRRGKLMQRTIKKRVFTTVAHSDSHQVRTSTGEQPSSSSSTSRFMSSYNVQTVVPSGDRLKPPPSAINFDRKVIKLGKRPLHSGEATTKTAPAAPVKAGCVKLRITSTTDSKLESGVTIKSPTTGTVKSPTVSMGTPSRTATTHTTLSPQVKSINLGNSSKITAPQSPSTGCRIMKVQHPKSQAPTRAPSTGCAIMKVQEPKSQAPARKMKLTRPRADQYSCSKPASNGADVNSGSEKMDTA